MSFAPADGKNSRMNEDKRVSLGDIFDEFLFNKPAPTAGKSSKGGGNAASTAHGAMSGSNVKGGGGAGGGNSKEGKDEDDGEDMEYDSVEGEDFDEEGGDGKKRKRPSNGMQRSMTEEQKIERRLGENS